MWNTKNSVTIRLTRAIWPLFNGEGMKTFDWIVVGAGVTGAALSYELVNQGRSVLMIEQHESLQGATRFGYGGVAYWAGTTDLTRRLCAEGVARLRSLAEELEVDPGFRDGKLLLTIAPQTDPATMAQRYAHFAIQPELLTVEAAYAIEPLLNPQAIAGALLLPHGWVLPHTLAESFQQAFVRLGGEQRIAQVTGLLRGNNQRVTGVQCQTESFAAANVVICAGALSRSLLKTVGISVPIYFTHAELIETRPVDLTLNALIMPADTKRFQLEADSTAPELEPLWDQPGNELAPPILDIGVVQLADRSLRIGQTSRVLTDPNAPLDPIASQAELRSGIGILMPALQTVPGTWHHCLVAFSRDRLPLIGALPGAEGLYVFSGFSNPLAIVPSLAKRFAAHVSKREDPLFASLSPARFA